MKIIRTDKLTPLTMPGSKTEQLFIYNGLDCMVTAEVLRQIKPQLDNQTRATYEFSKSLLAPCFEMRLRGVLVDQQARDEMIAEFKRDIKFMEENLFRILYEGLGVTVNWNSPAQMKKLLYGTLNLPPIKKRSADGTYQPTVDRDALEQLDTYFYAQPIIGHVLGLRDLSKKIGVLQTSIDSDGRMRTSYNVVGTSTGRLSSALNDFGTGTNLQNVEDRLRRVFVSDPGYKFAYIDGQQAESRACGAIHWNLFKDGRYLDACESGDLHTSVAKLAWAELPWTGDLKRDKELAEQPFYRQHSYRHMAKVLGHGTNYIGKPYTMAKHTKLDAKLIAEFQSRYFIAFPSFPRWHAWVESEVVQRGRLDTLTGRRRYFFGRRSDDSTIREAIAYDPQGSVADIINYGMLNVWRSGLCQLLLQVHDAILVQYPEEQEDELLPQILKLFEVPIELAHDRILVIPAEAKTGWNWASYDEKSNPDGLKGYKGGDTRQRQRVPALAQLDRRLVGVG